MRDRREKEATSLRFAIKPAVEQIARALHEMNGGSREVEEYRLRALEDQIAELQDTVRRLSDMRDFERELRQG